MASMAAFTGERHQCPQDSVAEVFLRPKFLATAEFHGIRIGQVANSPVVGTVAYNEVRVYELSLPAVFLCCFVNFVAGILS